MEWKKEKLSASELERRQREYMNEAMSMVRRSQAAPEPPAEPEPKPDEVPVAEPAAAVPEHIDEPEPVAEPAAEPEPEPADAEKPAESDNYGVYTADELLGAPAKNEGMKKAAEILEEMTRSTEFMRKLADGGEDAETTDFPKFEDCTGGDVFREEEGTEKDEAPRDDE